MSGGSTPPSPPPAPPKRAMTSPVSTSRCPRTRSLPHGCARLLHHRGLARRPARRGRHRHPVLCLGPRRPVPRGRGRGLHRRVRGRAHPEPVPALQREDQVRRAARQGARPRLRRGLHGSLRQGRHPRGRHTRVAPGLRHGEGPVVRPRGPRRPAAGPRDVPLGDTVTTKDEIRAEAERRGLAVARKPDSHDICFIADGDTQGFLARRLGTSEGDIVDESGARLGTHDGAYGFTIGQRKGLRIGTPAPTASRATSWTSPRWTTPSRSARRPPSTSTA